MANNRLTLKGVGGLLTSPFMSLHLISSRGDYREVPGLEMGAGGPLHFIKAQLGECLA